MPGLCTVPLNQPLSDGFLDRIELDPSGIISMLGWSKSVTIPHSAPELRLDSHVIPFQHHYRTSRPDVEKAVQVAASQAGVVFEYLLPESLYAQTFYSLSVALEPYFKRTFQVSPQFILPDYRGLLGTPCLVTRNKIYGSGTPNLALHPEVLKIARELPGPILDYGCGSGALIAELGAQGTVVRGLELAQGAAISPAVQSSVTLYDGTFPSPVPSGSARSVFCSEVLEHIPDYPAAVEDMVRIATERVAITVPDCSKTPAGPRHRLVPWHLLEGTHVNFFTQTSLEATLRPHFRTVEFGRICACPMNDTVFYVSIVAYCSK